MCSTAFEATQQSPFTQGIQGNVRQLSGDQMPRSIDESASSSSGNTFVNSSSNSAVQTTVWIFTARIPGNKSPRWPVVEAEQHPDLLCRLETNRYGHYSVVLPAGEYTVFAQYDNDLYLNAFQGDGSYMTVEVVPQQVLEMNITNIENAFF